MNRRTFIAAGASLSARALGANDRIRLGLIGAGGRGAYVTGLASEQPNVEIAAACDVYEPRRLQAAEKFGPQTKSVLDYREVLDRRDVDGVIIGSPDHWHVAMTIDAVAAGKDVYVEKPVTHRIEEGAKLIAAVEDSKQIVATGTQQRAWPHYKQAREIWSSGELGKMLTADCYWHSTPWPITAESRNVQTSKLDWERWLGPAPKQPFEPLKFTRWRSFWDFGGGGFDDFLTHWIDVVQWYLDEQAPKTVSATGAIRIRSEFEVFDTMNALIEYPGNEVATYSGSYVASRGESGIIFRGSEGVMKLMREGYAIYKPQKGWKRRTWLDTPEPQSVVNSKGDGTRANMENWLACMRSRQMPDASVRAGVAAARTSHLCNQAVLQQKRFTF